MPTDMVLPPIILDLVHNLRDQKNHRAYRENLYHRLFDMKRIIDKTLDDYEAEQRFRRK